MELQKTKQNQNRTKASATFTFVCLFVCLCLSFFRILLVTVAVSIKRRSRCSGMCLVPTTLLLVWGLKFYFLLLHSVRNTYEAQKYVEMHL